jgi:predicted nucleic acid-binding protein
MVSTGLNWMRRMTYELVISAASGVFAIQMWRSSLRAGIEAAVVEQGRQPPRRFADLLIASIALAEQLPLTTRKVDDFVGLEELITVVAV